tara:strand:+ start:828 stop:1445 length:618 start_codon:yes stop_codon:yes gene_type:complete
MSIKEDVSNLLIKFGLKDSDIIEAKKPEVKAVEFDREKFEDVALLDGTMIMVEPAVEVGAAVVVMDAELAQPMPVGEYELEDGRVIVIEEAGLIAAVNEPAAEGEEEEVTEELAEDDKAKEAKRIIESIVTEKVFKAVAKFNKQIEDLTDALSNEKKEKVDFMSEVAAILEKLGEQPAKKPIVAKQKSFGQEKSKNIFHKDLKNK